MVDSRHKDLRRTRSLMFSLGADDDWQRHRHGSARWPPVVGVLVEVLVLRSLVWFVHRQRGSAKAGTETRA